MDYNKKISYRQAAIHKSFWYARYIPSSGTAFPGHLGNFLLQISPDIEYAGFAFVNETDGIALLREYDGEIVSEIVF